MDKKKLMKREVKAIFNRKEREAVEADKSEMGILSHTIMRICRGATLFVIVLTPVMDLFAFDLYTVFGFFMSLLYTLSMLFILTPILYYLLALLFLKENVKR